MQDIDKQLDGVRQKAEAAQRATLTAMANQQKVAQATFNAEREILGLKRQQAEASLANAKTEQERIAAINNLYEVTVAEAELVYEQTMATAKAEERKMQALVKSAQFMFKQAQYKAAEAEAAGVMNAAHFKAIRQAQEALDLANENYAAQVQITAQVEKGAAALRDKTIAAAETLRQQQLQEVQQGRTNQKIGEGVERMNQLASAANNAAAAASKVGAAGNAGNVGVMNGGGKRGSSFTLWHGDQVYDEYKLGRNGNIVRTTDKERQQQMNQAHIGMLNERAKKDQVQEFLSKFDWDRFKQTGDRGVYFDVDRYAEGGYVTQPTNAIIGEGNDSEYVIPSGKMNEAMRRYSAGMRGSSVIPNSADVTVNYNGSTVDMGGSSYVNQGDVSGIVNQAVNATLGKLRGSSRARLGAGV